MQSPTRARVRKRRLARTLALPYGGAIEAPGPGPLPLQAHDGYAPPRPTACPRFAPLQGIPHTDGPTLPVRKRNDLR